MKCKFEATGLANEPRYHATAGRVGQAHALFHCVPGGNDIGVKNLNPGELLANTHKRVASLSESELLTQTDARAAIERNVIPPGCEGLSWLIPAVWAE